MEHAGQLIVDPQIARVVRVYNQQGDIHSLKVDGAAGLARHIVHMIAQAFRDAVKKVVI
jgi:hypothetical protein